MPAPGRTPAAQQHHYTGAGERALAAAGAPARQKPTVPPAGNGRSTAELLFMQTGNTKAAEQCSERPEPRWRNAAGREGTAKDERKWQKEHRLLSTRMAYHTMR